MNGKHRNDPDYVQQTTPPGSAYALSLHEVTITEVGASNKMDAGGGQ